MAIIKKIRDNSGSGKEFEDVTTSEVVYDTTPQVGSFNPVTSDGIARAISGSGEVPPVNPGDDGKVLTVVDGAAAWEEAQGGSSYTAGDGISLFNDKISVKHDSTLSEITAPTVYDIGDDFRYKYDPIISQRLQTAMKVRLGSVSDTATFAINTYQEYIDVCLSQTSATADPGLDGQYVKMVLANPSDRSKYVVGTVKSTATIEQSYNSSYQYYYAEISSSLSWTGTLSTMFDWGQLGVDDLEDSDGYIDLYFVACDSAGNVLTTGTYGPTDSMFVLGFNNLNVNVSLSSDTKTLRVANAVPGIGHGTRGKMLKATWSNNQASMEWDYATRTSGVISGDGSLSDPYKLDHDSTLSENNDVIRISGGDGVSFDGTSYAYSISITEEQAAALNAAMDLDPYSREVKVKLSFASTPVMKLTSATSSQCYLHIGAMTGLYSYAGVSQSIGTTDQNGELVADLSDVTVSVGNSFAAGTCYIWVSTNSTLQPTPGQDYFGTKLSFTSDGTTPIAADISVGKQVTRLFVTDPVPAYTTSENGKVLGVVDNSGSAELQWVSAGTTYVSGSSATVNVSEDSVTTNSVDVTGIVVGANVKSAVVQWKVNSTTTLPTVTNGANPLGASVNNPVSLTVGRIVQVSILNGTWVCAEFTDPANPLDLPSGTIRCKFSSGYTPTQGDTQTLVDAGENVWDIYKIPDDGNWGWADLFNSCTDLLEVLGANTTGVRMMLGMFNGCSSLTTVPLFDTSSVYSMSNMFRSCSNLTSVPLFDTSSVTGMSAMFMDCSNLTSVPLFDTSSVTDMSSMFYDCANVQSGALALYQQASGQTTPPTTYNDCFNNCGSNTVTGAAELAQIPASWGGTGA